MHRNIAKILLAVAALLAAPGSASAADYMVSIMQDDNQLAYATPQQRRAALTTMRTLGVEAVRVTMLWKAVAPQNTARKKPRGFNGADPGDYPEAHWDNYDDLVFAAQERGIAIYFNPSGAGPRWAHATTRDSYMQRSYRPSPEEFKKFMIAAGRRYSGTYRDENNGRRVLPRVSWWAIWNEPNQPGWLTPQGQRRKGLGLIAMSPHLYRDLVVAGAEALLRTGHANDLLLIGELAPLGSEKPQGPRPAIRPGIFLREMFCLNRSFKPFQGKAAKARGCDRLSRLGVLEEFPRLGFAHHPYTKKLRPGKRDKGKDALTMANIGKLPNMLDRIAARTGLLRQEMPIFLTEYGYETNPPDPHSGISPELQAQYINEGDFIAWRHSRVFSNTQFQLYDVPPRDDFPRGSRPYWFTYQSGLYTARPAAQAKPAAAAYKFPFVVRRRGATARLWGQVRFAPNGAPQTVYLQERRAGQTRFVNVGDPIVVSHNQGFFEATRPTGRRSTWRAVWLEADRSRAEISREARVS